MKRIRYIVVFIWFFLFVGVTFLARKYKREFFIIKVLKECYYGYDPFVIRGILTGMIYSLLDGFFSGILLEWFLKRRKKS